MKNSNIRTAKSQDLAAIKALVDANDLFPSEYLDDMFSGDSDPQLDQEFWLTYDDGGPQAVAYCAPERMTNGAWNLLLIAVHPDHQSKGVGRQIMSYVEETLEAKGVRILLVETSGTDDFARTRSFYDQIGYTNEARIRDYYDAGDDKVIYRKSL